MLTTRHLFAGYGGGLYADAILGHEPFEAVEIVPSACDALRRAARKGWFPNLTVHQGDIREYRPAHAVDQVCAGFPCQDVSVMGSGLGVAGGAKSGLWREVVRILRESPCPLVFLENSPLLRSRGLDMVLGDLADLGYSAEWDALGASDCGGSHRRARMWVLAYRNRDGLERLREARSEARAVVGSSAGGDVADDDEGWDRLPSPRVHVGRPFWNDADGCLSSPPWRGDAEGWREAASFGSPEPGLRRVDDAVANGIHRDRLIGLGNGQDAMTAAFAWLTLAHKILGN